MASLYCYGCERGFAEAQHPPQFADSGVRVCPSCRGDFIELLEVKAHLNRSLLSNWERAVAACCRFQGCAVALFAATGFC